MSAANHEDKEFEQLLEETRRQHLGLCKCHGESFCPDLKFSHYEDDVPVFKKINMEDVVGLSQMTQ